MSHLFWRLSPVATTNLLLTPPPLFRRALLFFVFDRRSHHSIDHQSRQTPQLRLMGWPRFSVRATRTTAILTGYVIVVENQVSITKSQSESR